MICQLKLVPIELEHGSLLICTGQRVNFHRLCVAAVVMIPVVESSCQPPVKTHQHCDDRSNTTAKGWIGFLPFVSERHSISIAIDRLDKTIS
jgi:hypothetical protein